LIGVDGYDFVVFGITSGYSRNPRHREECGDQTETKTFENLCYHLNFSFTHVINKIQGIS
jgi:hypothetical protein